MSANDKPCGRCGERTPTKDNIAETTFWGVIRTQVRTATSEQRSIRFLATYYRRNPRFGSPVLRVDDEQPLCAECWGLLVGRFMQGRSVPAMPGKEGR